MKLYLTFIFGLLGWPFLVMAEDAHYCPRYHAYIKVGMTQPQVVEACGEPSFKRVSGNNTVMQQIPVTQLIYSTLNQGSIFGGWTSQYKMWSLPSGSNGTSLEVDIVDNKVSGIRLNGNGTNMVSICSGHSVQMGDAVSSVYSACGAPGLVNTTYINRPVPSSSKPEVWTYQFDTYQPPMNLTFINGTLQSIE